MHRRTSACPTAGCSTTSMPGSPCAQPTTSSSPTPNISDITGLNEFSFKLMCFRKFFISLHCYSNSRQKYRLLCRYVYHICTFFVIYFITQPSLLTVSISFIKKTIVMLSVATQWLSKNKKIPCKSNDLQGINFLSPYPEEYLFSNQFMEDLGKIYRLKKYFPTFEK